ncbi:MAG: NUDIX domain-containing protein [Pseudohongiellaceae bacterium]
MTNLTSEFSADDVEIIERRELHRRFLRVDLITLKHRLHEGGWLGHMDREVMIREQAVGVLLYDPRRNEIVMVRQFRVGVLDEKHSPWLLELVAGMVDTDESPTEVATRECQEEADLVPADLIKICEYYNSPGASNEKVTLFCGRVDAGQAGGVFGLDEEHEDIEVVTLSVDEACAAVGNGLIDNAMSIIAIQWLQLNQADLQSRWS